MDVQKIGALIAQLRKEKGITQKNLAAKLQVSDRAVSKWERGLNLPNAELFEPLCEQLGISIMELLKGERNHAEQIAVSEAEKAVSAIAELAKIKERKTRWLRVCVALLVCALLACGILFVWEHCRNAEVQERYDSEYAHPTVTISNFHYSGKTEILNSYAAGAYFPDEPYDRELAMSGLAINYPADTTKWTYNEIISARDIELIGRVNYENIPVSDTMTAEIEIRKSKATLEIESSEGTEKLALNQNKLTEPVKEEFPTEQSKGSKVILPIIAVLACVVVICAAFFVKKKQPRH